MGRRGGGGEEEGEGGGGGGGGLVNNCLGLYYQTYNICQKYVTIRLNSKVKSVLTWPYEILQETNIYGITVYSQVHIPRTLCPVLMGIQYTLLNSGFYLRNPELKTLKKHRNRHSHSLSYNKTN